jgi:peptidoglycan hydrolase-like protein with peptidoglycan-binding domain
MHKAILTAAAVVALSAPAVAQHPGPQPDTNRPSETGQAAQPRPVPASPQNRAGQPISPQLLNSHQVREIQQALEARRAGAVRMNGEWGPDVEAALRNFQKSENLVSQNGELDALTLMALGLNPLSYGLSGTAETTGQALRDGAPQQERAQDAQEPPANAGQQNR